MTQKNWLSALTLILGAAGAFAPVTALASSSAVESFLATAWTDPAVELEAKNQSEYASPGFANPIEGLQFRLTQNEIIEDRRGAIRLSPRGFTQYGLLRTLRQEEAKLEALTYKQTLSRSLLERYNALANYIGALETKRLWSSIADLRSRKLSMLQTAARASAAKTTDLLKQRRDVEDAEIKQSYAENDARTALLRLKSFDPKFKESKVNAGDLPTPIHMAANIENLPVADRQLESQVAHEKATQMRNAVDYEVAKNDRLIDFVQLSVSQSAKDQRVGVEVSINVPGFASSEYSVREKTRELTQFEIKAREIDRNQSLTEASNKAAIQSAAQLYRSLVSVEDHATEKRLRRIVGRQDPLLAATIEEDSLQRNLRKIEISVKTAEAYFGYLAGAGLLADKAKTNFLSHDLRELRL